MKRHLYSAHKKDLDEIFYFISNLIIILKKNWSRRSRLSPETVESIMLLYENDKEHLEHDFEEEII